MTDKTETVGVGRLELILGPMFAGKTSELIRLSNRYKTIGKTIWMINHSINDRYNSATELTTHDAIALGGCTVGSSLTALKEMHPEKYESSDIIIIEEVQFFSSEIMETVEFIKQAIDNKIIIAAGLSGDYLRQPFPVVSALIPLAERVQFLHALCKECGDGTPAPFSKRVAASDEQVLIGGADKYEAVCRKHYF